ncbi:MAG: hypothetical protein ABEH43_03390 [Flavobacteriales bacterium]
MKNFFNFYMFFIDNWLFINNSGDTYEIIAEGENESVYINNEKIWEKIKGYYYGNKSHLKKEIHKIIKGLERSYKKLINYKKQLNSPLIIQKNGKIVEVDPNELPPTT